MFGYQLRLAWNSLKRNPILSLLMIGGIALGIGVAMIFVTAYYHFSGDPIPSKSDRLFYVRMDAWNPDESWDSDDPTTPPDQLTYTEAKALLATDIPTYKTAMYQAQLTVHPDGGRRPYRNVVRMCTADFFPMFEVPFKFGSGWAPDADIGPEAVVVLTQESNQQLFGGENSVGRYVTIEDREFRVVGVLADWRPLPLYYDLTSDEFGLPSPMFMPFMTGIEMELYPWGNTHNWKGYGDEYEDFLASEAIWIQAWAQLDSERQKDELQGYLDAYALEQQKSGRFGRINNQLTPVMAWLHYQEVVPDEATGLLIVSILFLVICSLNLIGILLGKFLARAPEVGVRRALGASRRWVFVQHLIECEVIGVVGGLLGLLLSIGGLKIVDRLFDQAYNFRPDLTMFLVAIALSLLSALLAGVYPAWRICRIQPGYHLKTQ